MYFRMKQEDGNGNGMIGKTQGILNSATAGEWRWTLYAENNKKVATSGESYKNKKDCRNAIGLVMDTNKDTPVKEA